MQWIVVHREYTQRAVLVSDIGPVTRQVPPNWRNPVALHNIIVLKNLAIIRRSLNVSSQIAPRELVRAVRKCRNEIRDRARDFRVLINTSRHALDCKPRFFYRARHQAAWDGAARCSRPASLRSNRQRNAVRMSKVQSRLSVATDQRFAVA